MVAEKEDLEDESPRIECPVLVTERLVLRPPHAEDIPDMARLAHNRRIAGMLARMPYPYGEAEARAFVEMAADGRFGGCSYAMTLAETGAFIGCSGLHPKAAGLELGYWIGEPFWGKGYATEAAHTLVDLAFRATDIDVLHAACRIINGASCRVIRKCGFQYAGRGVMDSLAAGQVPTKRYTLDRKSWIGLRQQS